MLLLLSTLSFSLIPFIKVSLSLSFLIQSQSLTSIKCLVTMATLATLGHRAVAVHSGISRFFSLCLFPVSLCLSLQLFPFSCFLSSAQTAEESVSLCFFIPPSLCGLVYPSLYLSLVCLLYMSPCLSLSVKRQSFSRVVESWLSVLSWSCQTYQSCAPAYLAVSDDDKSARLV